MAAPNHIRNSLEDELKIKFGNVSDKKYELESHRCNNQTSELDGQTRIPSGIWSRLCGLLTQ